MHCRQPADACAEEVLRPRPHSQRVVRMRGRGRETGYLPRGGQCPGQRGCSLFSLNVDDDSSSKEHLENSKISERSSLYERLVETGDNMYTRRLDND